VDAHTLFRAGPITTTLTAIPLLARASSEPYGFDRGANELIWGFSFDLDEDWAPAITLEDAPDLGIHRGAPLEEGPHSPP
jgi:hypothetical protein